MNTKTKLLASTAAFLFVAGGGYALSSDSTASEAEKIRCEGVNECKGHSACKTLFSSCAGHNGCKGKGFLMLTAEECDAAKSKAEAASQ